MLSYDLLTHRHERLLKKRLKAYSSNVGGVR